MTVEAMRGFVRAFHDALASEDYSEIDRLVAADVECTAFGPVDVFPFFGPRKGREAVLATIRQMGDSLKLRICARERMLFDGDDLAALARVTAEQPATGRLLTFRLAMFAQFANDKLVSLRMLFDSLDLAEQAIGRPIDLSKVA